MPLLQGTGDLGEDNEREDDAAERGTRPEWEFCDHRRRGRAGKIVRPDQIHELFCDLPASEAVEEGQVKRRRKPVGIVNEALLDIRAGML